MAEEIKMPRLSQTTDEVKLLTWLVQEGDRIEKGSPLCSVETDKVTMDVESYCSGIVLKLLAQPETVINAGTAIAIVGKAGESIKADAPRAPAPPQEAVSAQSARPSPAAGAQSETEIKATPLVRNIAKKRNIDLGRIRGTGPGGLITRADLEEYGKQPQIFPQTAHQVLPVLQPSVAQSVLWSKTHIPHFYMRTDINADALLAMRERHSPQESDRLSIYSFFVYAASRALRRYEKLNCHLKDGQLVRSASIDIGMAVARGEELYVPTVRRADAKSIGEIDREVKKLIAKAQIGQLAREDVENSSFTISNLGMFQIDEFYAIINPPQSGILSVGRFRKALDIDARNAMKIRTVCTVAGSFDHRIVNGASAAAFLQEVKTVLEGLEND